MMSSVITSPVGVSAISSVTATSSPDNNTQGTCYSCVDDLRIPPCAGFSQDYNCLPDLGKKQG